VLPFHLSTALGICFLDYGGPIAFDLKSEISVNFQIFGLVLVFSSVDRELRGALVIYF